MWMRLLALLAAIAVFITACGGSSPTPVDTATAAPIDGQDDATPAAEAEPAGEPEAAGEPDPAAGDAAPDEVEEDAEASDEPDVDAAPAVVSPEEAAAMADANQSNLTISDDPLATEVLVVADGSITSLRDAATGDRPLLLWFWAPH